MKTRKVLEVARRGKFLTAVVVVFATIGLAVMVREAIGLASNREAQSEITPVVVAEVREMEFADVITAVGTARARESVAVTSKVADIIKRVMFDSGDYVRTGQVLAELVDTEAAAELNVARTTLAEAQRKHERVIDLAEKGYVAAQMRDETESDAIRAAAQVEAMQARMTDLKIRAPFAGVVGLRNVSAGERISTSTVIATLNDLSMIKLDFTAPERFLSTIASGQRVHALVDAYPGEVFQGEITHIDNQVDRASRSVTVRAEIPNEDARLVPGMLLKVEVRRSERERPAIPESALMRQADQAYVFVVEPDGENGHIARRRDVEVGVRANGRIEVLAGVRPGDLVIADGTHRTRDGASVSISANRSIPRAAAVTTEAPE